VNAAAIAVSDFQVFADRRRILAVDRFEMGRGEMIGVLGPNGAGKTTLFRGLLGLERRASGCVRVLGTEMLRARGAARARVRRRLGYVPQKVSVGGGLPLLVREVIAIGRAAARGPLRRLGPEDERLVDFWMERLGLRSLADARFVDLSGGEQRKTLIARAMTQKPEILLLDEPSAYLDLQWRERLVRLVDELHREEGVGILMIGHEPEGFPTRCRRILLIVNGRLVRDEPADTLFSSGCIEALHGEGLRLVRFGERWAMVPGGSPHA